MAEKSVYRFGDTSGETGERRPRFSNLRWHPATRKTPMPRPKAESTLPVTDADLEYLKQIPLLEYLSLNKTAVTDQGIAGLQEALPHLSVTYGYPGQPGYRHIPPKVRKAPLREH